MSKTQMKRLNAAKRSLSNIERTLEPYVKEVIVEDFLDDRDWVESKKTNNQPVKLNQYQEDALLGIR